MCLEIYSSLQPIRLEFAHEQIWFESANSFRGSYTTLIKNAGVAPIDSINVLCPRSLCRPTENGGWALEGVRDTTRQIPEVFPEIVERGSRLTLLKPDPNRPQFDLPPLTGNWHSNNQNHFSVRGRDGFLSSMQLEFLHRLNTTFFSVELSSPLLPGEASWMSLEFNVREAGLLLDGPFGMAAVHRIVSPQTVAMGCRSLLATACEQVAKAPDFFPFRESIKELPAVLGLEAERNVDIALFELILHPGPCRERTLVAWNVEGDLRMSSESPRRSEDEVLFEWKAGSQLAQAAGGGAFKLFFTLQFDSNQTPTDASIKLSAVNSGVPPKQHFADGDHSSDEFVAEIAEKVLQRIASHTQVHFIKEMHVANNTTIHGDVVASAIGDNSHVQTRDVSILKDSVTNSTILSDDLKTAFRKGLTEIDGLQISDGDRGDLVHDVSQVADEMQRREPDITRVRRLWNRIKEIAPTVATVLKSAESIAKLLHN